MNAWPTCPLGCGFTHRADDPDPRHSAAWLERERVRLLAEVARLRGPGVVGSHWITPNQKVLGRPPSAVTSAVPPPAPVDELAAARAAREVPLLTDAANETGVTVGVTLEPPPRRPTRPRRPR